MYTVDGPFVTVYLNTRADTEDAARDDDPFSSFVAVPSMCWIELRHASAARIGRDGGASGLAGVASITAGPEAGALALAIGAVGCGAGIVAAPRDNTPSSKDLE